MSASHKSVSVLFVCMGNICRSPSAEGVLRAHIESAGLPFTVHIDSAGTHAYHTGEAPDPRAQDAAARRGVDLSLIRARAVEIADFTEFDFILAMDADNLAHLQTIQPADSRAQVELFLSYSSGDQGTCVPDPYYGARIGFEHVLDMLEDASEGFLEHLRQRS